MSIADPAMEGGPGVRHAPPDQDFPLRRSPRGQADPETAIVLVSNGPGELSTWVRPLAERLHALEPLRPLPNDAPGSLRLVLVPCPNATGQEHEVARAWGLFEWVVPARRFWWLLLRPHRHGFWPRRGVVVFLGGDQFWTVLLSARLGYRHLTYAEWVARWPRWNDRLALMGSAAASRLTPRWRGRAAVVGDLMADLPDAARQSNPLAPGGPWVALLPGSKRAKLQVGVPFLLAAADRLARILPEVRFLLPLAPTTSVQELLAYGGTTNPLARTYLSGEPQLEETASGELVLRSPGGTPIQLEPNHPAHGPLSQCALALTTVGANTAELGALGVPMIVLVPTQHLHLMQAWDGGLGILARLPFLRRLLGVALTAWRMRHRGFLAWPNISARRLVVPERVGAITPEEIAAEAADWLVQPHRLEGMRADLRGLRGQPGAVETVARMILALVGVVEEG
ncbi:MAG: glycosyl transferase [Cyanobacteriota bacterium]|nr:glycosyl transferase [Cyanobacteriota bacterium]